tara:strand:- start:429 stop:875 length:447 start_codon:yes stop_codon:yes gene_type:complete
LKSTIPECPAGVDEVTHLRRVVRKLQRDFASLRNIARTNEDVAEVRVRLLGAANERLSQQAREREAFERRAESLLKENARLVEGRFKFISALADQLRASTSGTLALLDLVEREADSVPSDLLLLVRSSVESTIFMLDKLQELSSREKV